MYPQIDDIHSHTLAVANPNFARRGLLIWTASIILSAACLIGFVLFMDPYAYVGAPRVDGVNAHKYEMSEFGRISKFKEITRVAPQGIVLGNSQGEGGFKTQTLERLTGLSFYNFSVLGAKIDETEIALKFALRNTQTRMVVLSLDLIALETDVTRARNLQNRADGEWMQTLRDSFDLHASLKALFAAAKQLIFNISAKAPSHDEYGNWVARKVIPIDDDASPIGLPEINQPALNSFTEICRLAKARNIELKIIIPPVYKSFGVKPQRRRMWIDQLTTIASQYNFLITDEGNDDKVTANKQNFIDRGHITKVVGDQILEQLFQSGTDR